MSHCISVTLLDGSVVTANVDDGVDTLPVEDMQALEDWVSYIRALNKKQHENKKTVKAKEVN